MNQGTTRENADWTAGFLFLGNQLTLDLLNTRPAPAGEPIELLSDFGALLQWFAAAELLSASQAAEMQKRWGKSARAQETLRAIWELRETLRREILRWEQGAAIHPSVVRGLNLLMARYPMRSKLKAGTSGLAAVMWFEVRQPEDLLAPLAHSAATLFANVDRNRVRKCAHCVAHFHDTSKKGTRRWCSMQLCGNRLKVAAYAARRRHRPERSTSIEIRRKSAKSRLKSSCL
jgi:predicted RNA-binding Zn ribbon-like protein